MYYALDRDPKYLGPILKPYLKKLFIISHENCWHIDDWKKNEKNEESYVLGRFCCLVIDEGLSPKDGITDALRKGIQEMLITCALTFKFIVENFL